MPCCIQPILNIKLETMTDKSSTVKQRDLAPHIQPLTKSDAAVDKTQEARIKRPIKTRKINLKTFYKLDDAKKWKELNSLINAGQGPLRLWKDEVNGKRVIYLRPRTWRQYLYETLFLFPDEQEARCDKVRAAIQMHIRPYLDAQTTTTVVIPTSNEKRTSPLPNAERVAIVDRLDCRVYTDRIERSSFYGNKPSHVLDKRKGDNIFCQDVRKTYAGMTTVPKGLSIAKMAPFKVTADVRILTKTTHVLADKLLTPGENSSPPDEWTCLEKKKRTNEDALQNYYKGMLEAYGQHKRTIVLEVGGDSDTHWRSAYDAANQWLAVQPADDKPSIMLVPLYRIDDFLPSKHSKAHNQGWSALMAEKLEMKDVKISNQVSGPPTSSISSNASGSVYKQKHQYESFGIIHERNSDNDNDNIVN
jgi:hypothetical protein